jgi:hypothetical protein
MNWFRKLVSGFSFHKVRNNENPAEYTSINIIWSWMNFCVVTLPFLMSIIKKPRWKFNFIIARCTFPFKASLRVKQDNFSGKVQPPSSYLPRENKSVMMSSNIKQAPFFTCSFSFFSPWVSRVRKSQRNGFIPLTFEREQTSGSKQSGPTDAQYSIRIMRRSV